MYKILFFLLLTNYLSAQSFNNFYIGYGLSKPIYIQKKTLSNIVQQNNTEIGKNLELGTSFGLSKKLNFNFGLFYNQFVNKQHFENIISQQDIIDKTTTTVAQSINIKHIGLSVELMSSTKAANYSLGLQFYKILPTVLSKTITGAGLKDPSFVLKDLNEFSKFDFSTSIAIHKKISIRNNLSLLIKPQLRFEPYFHKILAHSQLLLVPQLSLFLNYSKNN